MYCIVIKKYLYLQNENTIKMNVLIPPMVWDTSFFVWFHRVTKK